MGQLRYAWLGMSMLAMPLPTYAEAWTQEKGRTQIITQATFYRTDTFFDINGNEFSQEPLLKFEINPYIEYGFTDATTLGLNIAAQYITSSSEPQPVGSPLQTQDFYGGVTELFVRQRLWHDNNAVVSVQPLVKLPSYYVTDDLTEDEFSSWDAKLSIQGGINFKAAGYDHYVSADAGYRHRFGDPADQASFDITLGTHLTSQWMILTQLFNTFAINAPDNPIFTGLGEDDYTLNKLQLSALYRFNERYAVQVGGFSHLHSENTGGGGGGLLALWISF